MFNIKELAEKYYPEYQRIREHMHQYPEVANEEVETQKFIEAELDKLGIPHQRMYNTGVVALIEGGKPGKTVLLRADIDALPINEECDVDYKSKKPGYMHACGHDGHTAGVFAAAMILNEIKDELCGNVKLMFQPAEETDGGALPMIEAGILENPKVDAAFGVHLWGPLPYGKVFFRDGAMMAAPDQFTIKIIGKGCHAAMPHLGIDPVMIAADALQQFQEIVSRKVNPLTPVVISTGVIQGGTTFNVIPQEVMLNGTVRSFDPVIRKKLPEYMEDVLKGLSLTNKSEYTFDYEYRYPPVINNKEMNELAKVSLAKIIGQDNIKELEEPNMGGEDFAYLCEAVPSSFMFVGIHKEGEPQPVHHHPEFGFDSEILKVTGAGFAQIAVDFLNGQ